MLNSVYISDKSFEELISLFFFDVLNDDDYYDVVAYNLALNYQEQLQSMLHLLSFNRLRGAICGLGLAGKELNYKPNIKTYLDHENPLIVAATIDALRRTDGGLWDHISILSDHESPYVRGAVLRYCKATLRQESTGILLLALKDSHPVVRENALDELEGIADETMVSCVSELLNDPDSSVRTAAENLIYSINPN